MRMAYWFIACGMWIALSAGLNVLHAQPRAWLDRDQIKQNENVTLSIETDQLNSEPDYRPLEADFILGARSQSQQMQLTARGLSQQSRFDIELIPRRSGLLTIGPLAIGQHKTIALPLNVEPAPNTSHSSTLDEVFVQTLVDSTQPYVQQNVGIVIRLGHAVPIVSGDLNLPEPANTTLQRVGEDQVHKEMINGRQYTVLERRFILVPERSGPLALHGAYFKGITGHTRLHGSRMTVTSDNLTLQVQALPNPPPQPWRPLHALQLRYRLIPDTLTAGEAATLEIEASATGAHGAQLNEIPIPELEGAGQIFAEPVSAEENFTGASPELKLVRRYAIVPHQAGNLVIKGIQMPWWNVQTGQLVNSGLTTLTLPVQAAAGQSSNNLPLSPAPSTTSVAETGFQRALRWLWPVLAVFFALLWLATLIWMLIRRSEPATQNKTTLSGNPAPGRHYHLPDLRRALEQGSVDEVLHMLVTMSGTHNLDAALVRLADPTQRQAIEALQRARWRGEGDLTAARTQLNHAFRNGPQWKIAAANAPIDELPPLYPSARSPH